MISSSFTPFAGRAGLGSCSRWSRLGTARATALGRPEFALNQIRQTLIGIVAKILPPNRSVGRVDNTSQRTKIFGRNGKIANISTAQRPAQGRMMQRVKHQDGVFRADQDNLPLA